MAENRLRVATAVLTGRIFAGRPTKDGLGFKEPRHDVTSDVLVAIRDKVGIGNQVNVESDGKVEFRIAVLPPETENSDLTAASQLEHSGLISREKYNHIVENIRARESIRGAMA